MVGAGRMAIGDAGNRGAIAVTGEGAEAYGENGTLNVGAEMTDEGVWTVCKGTSDVIEVVMVGKAYCGLRRRRGTAPGTSSEGEDEAAGGRGDGGPGGRCGGGGGGGSGGRTKPCCCCCCEDAMPSINHLLRQVLALRVRWWTRADRLTEATWGLRVDHSSATLTLLKGGAQRTSHSLGICWRRPAHAVNGPLSTIATHSTFPFVRMAREGGKLSVVACSGYPMRRLGLV